MDPMKSARWLSLRWFKELAWNMGVSMAPGAIQNTSTPAYRSLQCCNSNSTNAAVAAAGGTFVVLCTDAGDDSAFPQLYGQNAMVAI